MNILDSVDFVRPVQVNGYPCRNMGEVQLARMNLDPKQPEAAPPERPPAAEPTNVPADPVQIEVARRAAEIQGAMVVGYSPEGTRPGRVDPGSVYSVRA